jgi:hypothetical protein
MFTCLLPRPRFQISPNRVRATATCKDSILAISTVAKIQLKIICNSVFLD